MRRSAASIAGQARSASSAKPSGFDGGEVAHAGCSAGQRGLACGSIFGLAMEKGAAPTLATK
jgi:hypothetical protein